MRARMFNLRPGMPGFNSIISSGIVAPGSAVQIWVRLFAATGHLSAFLFEGAAIAVESPGSSLCLIIPLCDFRDNLLGHE